MIYLLDFTKLCELVYELQKEDFTFHTPTKASFDTHIQIHAANNHHEIMTEKFGVCSYLLVGHRSDGLSWYDLYVEIAGEKSVAIEVSFDAKDGNICIEWYSFCKEKYIHKIFFKTERKKYQNLLHDITSYLVNTIMKEEPKLRLHFATRDLSVTYLTDMPALEV